MQTREKYPRKELQLSVTIYQNQKKKIEAIGSNYSQYFLKLVTTTSAYKSSVSQQHFLLWLHQVLF